MIRRHKRPGFTLLEVLLAMGIGVMLLGALYVAVETQLKNAQAAREIVEQSTLARALLTRIGNDISSTLQLSDPGRFRNQANSSSSASASSSGSSMASASGTTGSGTTNSTSGTGATGTNSSGLGTSGTTSTTNTTSSGTTTSIVLPLGLIGPDGDNTTLHIFTTRLPRQAIDARGSDQPPAVSDTRRISYWLAGGGSNGLARQEVQPVTSDDTLQNIPPSSVEDENSFIIAEEVKSLTFSYWGVQGQVGGQVGEPTWNDSWDCTQVGADGVTPIGPPIAVAIEIGLPVPGNPDAPPKIYRHVVYIMATNGATPLNSTTGTTGTTNTMNGGGTTSP